MDAGERLRLVVTDVVMPVMSGRDLASRIATIRPGLPVIFMSGYTDEDVIRRGLMQRGSRFLQKPFSPDTLARQVHQALTRDGGGRISSAP
jgi:two-component system cell cycle sensor histidine kinase/response regulator CckA